MHNLKWKQPKSPLQIVVLVEGEIEGRVSIASTASEYPLAIFGFREPSPPKPEKCLLGTSQTLIRKEARYHDGKQETEYPGEVLCDRRGKETDRAENGSAPDKADRRLPAEDGD